MDSFNFHKLKAGKANKIQKHRQLRKIANLLRYVEMCVVLVLISRLSFQQLPLALKNSSEYLRGFTISPRLVFLVGNIIIIALFAQSGQFSPARTASDSEPDLLYLEFLQNSTVNQNKQLRVRAEKNSIKGHRNRIDGCMTKHPEKQSTKTGDDGTKLAEKQSTKKETGSEGKDYRRCQSEITRDVKREIPRRLLQRSESESDKSKRRIEGAVAAPETERVGMGRTSYPEDGMSNDEFRRTVEAFIARQQRLRIQELQAFYS